MNRTVERLINSSHVYQSKRNFMLYKTTESYFLEFHFGFELCIFFRKKLFCLKTEISGGVIFVRIRKLKKSSVVLYITKICFF